MELLELLERRVDDLLADVGALRVENRRLRETAVVGQPEAKEMTALRQQLEKAEQIRKHALARVDALLDMAGMEGASDEP